MSLEIWPFLKRSDRLTKRLDMTLAAMRYAVKRGGLEPEEADDSLS